MFGDSPQDCQVISINASDLASAVSQTSLHFYKTDVPGGQQTYRPTTMQDSVAGGPMWLIQNPGSGTTLNVVKMTNLLTSSPSFTSTALALPAAYQFPDIGESPTNPDSTQIQGDDDDDDDDDDDTSNSSSNIDYRILKAGEYNNTIVATHNIPVGTAAVVSAKVATSMGVAVGGSGYRVGDVLTVSGGTFSTVATLRVATLGAGGAVATVTVANGGDYSSTDGVSALPTGGNGSGVKLSINFHGELAAQWYAINVAGSTPAFQVIGGVPNVGRIGYGQNTDVFYPGVNINSAGEIGMSFMESDTLGGAANPATQGYVSTFVTARTPTDPAGTMEAPVLVPTGIGTGDITDRAGDFSGLSVDPVNGTFWRRTNSASEAIPQTPLQTST